MKDYRITDHRDVPGRCRQLSELARLTFGQHAGAIAATQAFTEWYVRRPGMSPDSCSCALVGDEMVANVFVTLQSVQLGGQLLQAGLIDTVMTHPDHQRQGLATTLLARSAEHMRTRGASLSLLYTTPGSPAHRLYKRIGYVDVMGVRYYSRPPRVAPAADGVHAAGPDDHAALRLFLDSYFAHHDSYTPTNDALWRWRRLGRPAGYRAKTLVAEDGGSIVATGTMSQATFIRDGKPKPMTSLNDVALERACDPEAAWQALLSRVPDNVDAIFLVPECDAAANGLAEGAGFCQTASEAAMIRPLTDDARRALERPVERWYVVTESVIGV